VTFARQPAALVKQCCDQQPEGPALREGVVKLMWVMCLSFACLAGHRDENDACDAEAGGL
jgi:hypothetical protein